MSVFFTDPFTGTNGDAWDTGKWTTSTLAAAGDTALLDIQSNHGRLRTTGAEPTAGNLTCRAVAVDGDHSDIDLLITGLTYNAGPTTNRFLQVFVRASGDWPVANVIPTTGYRIFFDRNGTLLLHRHDDGGESQLDTSTWTPTQNNNCRIVVEGDDIKVRVWQEGQAEPETWDMEAIDATYASGTIQLSTFTVGTNTTTTEWLIDQIDADNPALFTGSTAATQAADTSTASGTHTPPAFTGTAAPAQAADTSTASGTHTAPTFTATASPTQAADTSTASGTFVNPTLTGTAAPTQEDDTSTASGTYTPPPISGTAAPTQTDDTPTASGTFVPPTFTGTVSVTQAADTPTAAGTFVAPVFTATAAPTQEADTSTASGTFTLAFTGSVSVTQAANTSTASGTFLFTGALTIVAREIGQFHRITGRLHLAPILRGARRGFRLSEGWERVSDPFIYDGRDDEPGDHATTMTTVTTAWAAHAGADAATLKTAVHTALDGRGYRRPDGSRLI